MSHPDWSADPPRPPPPPPQQSVPVQWSTAGVPMVIVAPPQTDSAPTRGLAGWYVLLLMTLAAVVAVYYAIQTWKPEGGLVAKLSAQQQAISLENEIRDYKSRLIIQTNELERAASGDLPETLPEILAPPELLNQISIRLKEIEEGRKANISLCKKNIAVCKERTKDVKCDLSKTWCDQMEEGEAAYDSAEKIGDSAGMSTATSKIAGLFCEANLALCNNSAAAVVKVP